MKAEAHVWVVESRLSVGYGFTPPMWRPIFHPPELTRERAKKAMIGQQLLHPTCKYRIRKYVRPPPCGSEGK